MYLKESIRNGSDMAKEFGKQFVESMKENPALAEGFNFKEDNDMANSGDLYTVQLANAIYYKSYDTNKKYYDLVINLTPAMMGYMDGAGSYKIPKIFGSTAAKISGGEVVDYVNDNKDSIVLETEKVVIGTRINSRLIKRGAKGFISKLMTAASDAIHRFIARDICNNLVAAAPAGTVIAGGASYDSIQDAKLAINNSKDPNGIEFGMEANYALFSEVGYNILSKSVDFKSFVQMGARNVPGAEVIADYIVWSGLRIMHTPLINTTKGGAAVHAVIIDTMQAMTILVEGGMETYDGRIPGTPGDMEIIMGMDYGIVANNIEGLCVITA